MDKVKMFNNLGTMRESFFKVCTLEHEPELKSFCEALDSCHDLLAQESTVDMTLDEMKFSDERGLYC